MRFVQIDNSLVNLETITHISPSHAIGPGGPTIMGTTIHFVGGSKMDTHDGAATFKALVKLLDIHKLPPADS